MNLFIITSVINVVSKPLTYSKNRSVFSENQRLIQTIDTIKSIRNKNENCRIMLVDCSNIDSNTSNQLKELVDYFYDCYKDSSIRKIVESMNKSWGECEIMKFALIKVLSINDFEFDNIFKISGRYFLNDDYDVKKFINNKINIRVPWNNGYNRWVSTCLYSFPRKDIIKIIKIFTDISENYKSGDYKDVETNFLKQLEDSRLNLNLIGTLGVSGLIAVNGDLCSH